MSVSTPEPADDIAAEILRRLTVSTSRWLTVEEAAEYARVSFSMINSWMAERKLPYSKLGKIKPGRIRNTARVVIDRQDLDRFLESCKVAAV